MFVRRLPLPPPGTETFFLWGPRLTGKSTLLRAAYPDARWLDLLKTDVFRRYLTNPEWLRAELPDHGDPPFVVIDEVQKLPALLDEVHWLHENRGVRFALCGSSARKVRRGHANLLGGRALRYTLHGLSAAELGETWDLDRLLNHGYLPRHYLARRAPWRQLDAYVAGYLKEEVAAEGLVRNLPTFSAFLDIAALSDAEPVNYSTVARDCGVSSQTVKNYFDILVDTLLARWLPAFRKRPKRRVAVSPKLYFADVGVVNFLAKRRGLEPGSPLYGKAFENWCFHELSAYADYAETYATLSFWRLASGAEVDFVVDDMAVAMEAKATHRVTSDHLKGLRQLRADHPEVGPRYVVSLEPRARRTEDGIEVLPAAEFVGRLWDGAIF